MEQSEGQAGAVVATSATAAGGGSAAALPRQAQLLAPVSIDMPVEPALQQLQVRVVLVSRHGCAMHSASAMF